MKKYEEQLNRVRRYFHRFEEINNGKKHDTNSDYYIDDIYAFFMNCYHLRDWLINDPTYTRHKTQEIDSYINANKDSLLICADICNGIKHLKQNKVPRSGSQPKFRERKFTMNFTNSLSGEHHEQKIQIQVKIEHRDKKIDAFEIAKKSLKAWETFLNK